MLVEVVHYFVSLFTNSKQWICLFIINLILDVWAHKTKLQNNYNVRRQCNVPTKTHYIQNIKSQYQNLISSSWCPARFVSYKWKLYHTNTTWQTEKEELVFFLNGLLKNRNKFIIKLSGLILETKSSAINNVLPLLLCILERTLKVEKRLSTSSHFHLSFVT